MSYTFFEFRVRLFWNTLLFQVISAHLLLVVSVRLQYHSLNRPGVSDAVILKDYFTVVSKIFFQASNPFLQVWMWTLLILPEGVHGRFPDKPGLTFLLHMTLKWFVDPQIFINLYSIV